MASRKAGVEMGRPRRWDKDQALDCAMRVFWEKGFVAASMADLTSAMGINAPSLYAAFGNKEGLFQAVMERYAKGPAAYLDEALKLPGIRKIAEHIWQRAASLATPDEGPVGCLWVRGLLSSGGPCELNARLAGQGAEALRRTAQRFAELHDDVRPGTDVETLARLVLTYSFGLSVQASSGATRAELADAIRLAVEALPLR